MIPLTVQLGLSPLSKYLQYSIQGWIHFQLSVLKYIQMVPSASVCGLADETTCIRIAELGVAVEKVAVLEYICRTDYPTCPCALV